MCRYSLFIFSSEMTTKPAAHARLRALIVVLIWTVLFVVLFDAAINLLFKMPVDPKVRPASLNNYFDYGRSIEGKLRRTLAQNDAAASPITLAGWLERDCHRTVAAEPGQRVISFFGMSFSSNVGIELQKIDPTFKSVLFAGPGAPPSHSYRCFLLQQAYAARGGVDVSEIQVFGILASSVKGMLSMTGATTGFESPAPFTYPRYLLDASGNLQEILPLVNSPEDWRLDLNSADKSAYRFRAQLLEQDRFYNPILFATGWTDHSVILRMLRRAYAQRSSRQIADTVMVQHSYIEQEAIGPVLKSLVFNFAQRVKATGKRPIILLLQDGNSGDALFKLLGPSLEEAGLEFVSTHDIAPTTNSANFVSDGHFSAAANHRITKKLLQLIASH